MKLNEWQLPEDRCKNLSIRLLIFYAKGKMSRQEERLIDAHCEKCEDCRFNLAYITEIIKGKEKLSIDEQTLLLKYLEEPIYKENIQTLKDEIKDEIRNEIKAEILSEIKAMLLSEKLLDKSQILVNDLFDKHFASLDKLNKLENIDINSDISTINIAISSKEDLAKNESFDKKDFSKVKPFNRKTSQTTVKKVSSAHFILSFLVVVLLSLTFFTYLTLNKHQQTSTPISSLSSYESPIIPNITQQNKPVNQNLYQELDSFIDKYLESKKIEYLEKAESTAQNIDYKYGDKYGVDLVVYYKSVPSSAIEKLSIAHKALTESFEQASGDNYQQRLEASQRLEKDFLSLGDLVEAYKAKALINKLYSQLNKDKEASLLTQEGLNFSSNNNYLFLQLHFLLWKAKRLSEIPDFVNAEEAFKQVIELGNKLSLYKSVNSAGSSLATLYYRLDYNKEAFELSSRLLINFTDYQNTQAITLLQMAGLAAFNLHYYNIAESYLKEALSNSQKLNLPALTVRSYSFLALIFSEQKNFDEANGYYLLAEKELKNIDDKDLKQETLGVLIGYKAKTKLLEGSYEEALKLYTQGLSIINTLGLNNNLEISQINEAMAIALTQLGQKDKAQEHNAIAKAYKNLAEANNQTNNCLLSLAPTNCLTRQD